MILLDTGAYIIRGQVEIGYQGLVAQEVNYDVNSGGVYAMSPLLFMDSVPKAIAAMLMRLMRHISKTQNSKYSKF